MTIRPVFYFKIVSYLRIVFCSPDKLKTGRFLTRFCISIFIYVFLSDITIFVGQFWMTIFFKTDLYKFWKKWLRFIYIYCCSIFNIFIIWSPQLVLEPFHTISPCILLTTITICVTGRVISLKMIVVRFIGTRHTRSLIKIII